MNWSLVPERLPPRGPQAAQEPARTPAALARICLAQQPELKTRTDAAAPAVPQPQNGSKAASIVPAGTRIPLQLRQPVSTKTAQPGDPIAIQTFAKRIERLCGIRLVDHIKNTNLSRRAS